jgi:hypothetical protein
MNQLTDTYTKTLFVHSEGLNMASNTTYHNAAMISSYIDIGPNSKLTLARKLSPLRPEGSETTKCNNNNSVSFGFAKKSRSSGRQTCSK